MDRDDNIFPALPVKLDYSLTGANSTLAVEKGLAEAEWYQSPIPRDTMRGLLKRRNGPALRDTILWFALILGCGFTAYMLRATLWFIVPYLIYCVLYASTSDSRWHESSHGTPFRTGWVNDILYEIASFMVMRESIVWRWSHNRHHSDTNIIGRDPEIAVPLPPDLKAMVMAFFNFRIYPKYFRQIVLHFLGRISADEKTFIPAMEFAKVYLRARIYVLIYAAAIALSIYTRSIYPLLFIGLPNLFGAWLMPIYGFTQHAGLAENVLDHRLNCRTVYMNPVPRQNSDGLSNQVHRPDVRFGLFTCKTGLMLRSLRLLLPLFSRFFRSRRDLLLENLALRQQLCALKRRRPQPRSAFSDKLLWTILQRLWPGWRHALVLVQPETVVRWHRTGFRLFWTWLSRHRSRTGRKCVSRELRGLIFRMVAENSTWGAPRIHGELKMLGFDISERTVLRWMQKAPRNPEPAKRWVTFLSNHREAIAAMDFFTVPTLTFGVLYCFFVIAHDRRRVLHFNVTRHPSSAWIVQQLREAFPYDSSPKYLIFDRGANFNQQVIDTVKSFGIQPKQTSFRSSWQNGVAERWIGNCRRDLLDHVIVLNERHLKRLMNEYVRYYHEDRTHLSLGKGTPAGREAQKNPDAGRKVISMPRLGGLHHRYDLAA